MSHIISGLLGAALVALTVGFGPLAAGALSPSSSAETSATAVQTDFINRAAKSDRTIASSFISGQPAVIVQAGSLVGTSIAIKPDPAVRRESRFGSAVSRGEHVRRAVACEPVVSVLTEAARLLEPGRCVT